MNPDSASPPEQVVKPDSAAGNPPAAPVTNPLPAAPQPAPAETVSAAAMPADPLPASEFTAPPATAAPAPVTPAQEPAATAPVQPVPANTGPFQPVVPGAGPQLSAEVPAVGSRRISRKLLIPVAALLAVAVLAASTVYAINSLSGSSEVKTGKDFILAVRDKDYGKVAELSDSNMADLGNKIEDKGGAEAEKAFYKSFLHSASEDTAAGTGNPKKVKVDKVGSGDNKFAVVVYKLDGGYVTVLESYENDEPRVVSLETGRPTYNEGQLKDDYKQYKDAIGFISSMVDQIASSSKGDDSKTLIELFGSQ